MTVKDIIEDFNSYIKNIEEGTLRERQLKLEHFLGVLAVKAETLTTQDGPELVDIIDRIRSAFKNMPLTTDELVELSSLVAKLQHFDEKEK